MRKVNVKKRKIKKNVIIASIVLILVLIIAILVILKLLNNKENSITLINDLEFEINSEVKIGDLVEEMKEGTITNSDEVVNTDTLGNVEVVLKVTNGDSSYDYKVNIKIVDTTPPVIEMPNEITTTVGESIDLYEYATITDNSNDLDNVTLSIVGEYDFNKEGVYELKMVASDSEKNESFKEFSLKVESDPNNRTITTSKGYTLKIIDGVAYIDGILIVNKTYSLPSSYETQDAYKDLSGSYNSTEFLTKDTMNAFKEMQSDASNLGLNLYIASGYRSYDNQYNLYNSYVANDGKENADTYSARAGHSEHQTGLAFDLNSVNSSFANTDEGIWVKDNCYKYGFIIRYPKGKESITGYMYEPWHLRYVGEELAEKLYNNGNWLTIEEYYGIDSEYQN